MEDEKVEERRTEGMGGARAIPDEGEVHGTEKSPARATSSEAPSTTMRIIRPQFSHGTGASCRDGSATPSLAHPQDKWRTDTLLLAEALDQAQCQFGKFREYVHKGCRHSCASSLAYGRAYIGVAASCATLLSHDALPPSAREPIKQTRLALDKLLRLSEDGRVMGDPQTLIPCVFELIEWARNKLGEFVDAMEASRKMAFVLMSFHDPFSSNFVRVFRPALEEAGYEARRADSLPCLGILLDHIRQSIRQSDLILAEISAQNGNVLYELGMAHAFGKPTIIVSRLGDEVPSNVSPQRIILYDPQAEGWQRRLRLDIASAAYASNDRGRAA